MNLFVYGTLRPDLGHPMALRLAAVGVARGRAWIEGILYDLGDYPGLILRAGAGRVHGLLYTLPHDDPLWAELDAYEDVRAGHSAFARVSAPVWAERTGGWIDAVVYVYQGDPGSAPVVASGDWAAHCGR